MTTYDIYFKSGFYDKRYPTLNRLVADKIKSSIKSGKIRTLDYGCGNGRYLVPISKMECASSLTGFDISETALKILEERLKNTTGKKCAEIDLTNDFKDVVALAEKKGKINLVLILFGVYSCLTDADKRKAMLKQVIEVMDHENNRMILSVPNQYRRFWLRQLKHHGSSLEYRRKYNGFTLNFKYKLFKKQEIVKELEEAGFTVLNVQPQSILSECQVTNSPFLAGIDRRLCSFLPAGLAYDYLVEAKYERRFLSEK